MPTHATRPVRARILLMALAAWVALLVVAIPLWIKSDRSAARLPAQPADGTARASAPVRFTSAEGRFSAEFPSKPVRKEVTSHAAAGDAGMFFSSASAHGTVLVAYQDLTGTVKDGNVPGILESRVERAVEHGTLESTTPVTVYGSPGVDFVVRETDGSTLLGRLVLVGATNPRLFTLLAEPIHPEGGKTAYDRLLETFTLTA